MKNIHPTYFKDAKITCACGAAFDIGSTVKEIRIELCAKCHPFYTGEQKIVDTARRVEKFQEKMAKAQSSTKGGKKEKRAKRSASKTTDDTEETSVEEVTETPAAPEEVVVEAPAVREAQPEADQPSIETPKATEETQNA